VAATRTTKTGTAGRRVRIRPLKRAGVLIEEMDEIERRLASRAFALFERRGWSVGRALDDWLQAERELLWRPAAELIEIETAVRVRFALAGLAPSDVEVLVGPDRLTVRAEVEHGHRKDWGALHFCEFHRGRLYRSLALPGTVVPDKAKAEMRAGLLTVTIPKVTAPAARTIPIQS
jgi:HSP20 family molecular chaperone IbpA